MCEQRAAAKQRGTKERSRAEQVTLRCTVGDLTGNQLTSFPGNKLTSYPGNKLTSCPGKKLTSYPGTKLTSYPGNKLARFGWIDFDVRAGSACFQNTIT